MENLGIYSEIGTLREVIVQGPDRSFANISPENCQEYLIDDLPWLEKAQSEHSRFVELMQSKGIIVHMFSGLLRETLENMEARDWILNKRISHNCIGAMTSDVIAYLKTVSSELLATYLMSGMRFSELPEDFHKGMGGIILEAYDLILPSLPNHLFTRDASCWVQGGYFINPMYWPVRRHEAMNVAVVYKFHPHFANASMIWGTDKVIETNATCEGGDVLPVSDKVLLIGMGERTTHFGIDAVAEAMFAKSPTIEKIIVAQMPRARSCMHLDTIFTMCSEEVFTGYRRIVDHIRPVVITKGDKINELIFHEENDHFVDVLVTAIYGKRVKYNLVDTGGDKLHQAFEQWNDGNNVFTISPGEVISYDRNVETIKALRNAGIQVYPIHGSELSRCRGGARCMTCPILRDAVSF